MWNCWTDLESSATHIIGHWNYNTSTTKNVSVVSTADKVELKLNGKTIGTGVQTKQFLFTFPNVAWQSGELEAVGYTKGSQSSSDKRTTAGAPAAIKLTAHTSPAGFRADGSDIALIDVEVVDSNGKRNPIALNTISFKLSGEAEWRGGIAQGPDNYILSKTLPVENGVNRVLLRSTTKAGNIVLEASSDGLTSASITLSTRSFPVTDGLSTVLPSADLPADLSRGPTPGGESYTPTRKPLTIASVTAGSNTANASYTIDDNEASSWTSAEATSSNSSAWIKFELDGVVKVSQLVIKTKNFRNAYPVAVKVDGKVAWNGTTEKTLGYVTLHLKETEGISVEVSLTGAKGTLGITEVELYGPI